MSAPDYDDWASGVGTDVTLTAPNGRTMPLLLNACSTRIASGEFESYSLTFSAGPDAPRDQAVYNLTLDPFDATDVFLVPIALGDGVTLEAVFNQRRA